MEIKKKINCFDYNTNDNQGNILIKTKSKTDKNNNEKILNYIIEKNAHWIKEKKHLLFSFNKIYISF